MNRKTRHRLLAVVLGPLLTLGAVEGALRLANVGYDPSFAVHYTAPDGSQAWIHNLSFGRLFFPGTQARTPLPFILPTQPPPNPVRVLVLGGSAAAGDPETDYGFSRILNVLLDDAEESVNVDVINAAMTAINSHVVRQIACDSVKRIQPDAVVLYLGHNEIVGPFGPATPGLRFRRHLPIIRASIAARRSRLGQSITSLQETFRDRPVAPWRGMAQFLDQTIPYDDPRLATVYDHLEQNLRAVIDLCLARDIPVVLCTVPCNLTAQSPFASMHDDHLGNDPLAEWESHVGRGIVAQGQNRYAEAIAAFEKAAMIDHGFAELVYRMAQCQAALGQAESAAVSFHRARDLDGLRFRADGAINDRIRRLGAEVSSPLVRTLDVEELFASETTAPAPGLDLFVDHVHMNVSGNYLLARAVADELIEVLPGFPGDKTIAWTTEETCRQRLAFTAWDESILCETLYRRRLQPPWTLQFDHRGDLNRLLTNLISVREARQPEQIQASLTIYEEAVAASPDDWIVAYRASKLATAAGLPEAAAQLLERVIDLVPHLGEPYLDLSRILVSRTGDEAAAQRLRDAPLPRPFTEDRVMYLVAEQCVRADKPEEGIAWLKRAMAAGQDGPGVQVLLARAQSQLGRHQEALRSFEKASELDPTHADLQLAYGQALIKSGRTEEAVDLLRRVVQQHPYHADSHIELARILVERPGADDVLPVLQRAVELSPLNPVPRLYLGEQLATGEPARARHELDMVLRLNPDKADLLYRAGNLSAKLGEMPQAVSCFLRATERRENWIPPANNAAWILATTDDPDLLDPDQAVRLAKHCDTLAMHQSPEILDTLSASYAAAGRFDVAVRIVDEALAIADEQKKHGLVEELRNRRTLYREQRRYVNQG